MKKRNIMNIGLAIILVISALISFSGQGKLEEYKYKAEITKAISITETKQQLEVKILSGELDSQELTLINDESIATHQRVFNQGERVMVFHNPDEGMSYVLDYERFPQLLVLFLVFVLVAVLVTGVQGIGALVGLGLSFIVIFKLILPLILQGYSPVWVAIFGSILIIPLTFYPSHGINMKSNIAIISTFITLIIAGLLATFFADYAHLTGLASEESNFLMLGTASQIDFQGLILAGILISILGILDDITISQASVVQQLKLVKKNIQFPELFTRALSIGRDHIASLVNTLVLVYAGASLPVLLLFLDYSNSFVSIINLEFIAEEVVRTLIGSIALILAVPITTVLAAFTSIKGVKVEEHGHDHSHG